MNNNDLAELHGEYVKRKAWFGTLAYLLKYIEVEEADEVLQRQAADSTRFGEVAVDLGFMTEEQVKTVLFFQSSPVSFGDVVLASQKLDRDTIGENLTLFASYEAVS